MAGRKAYQNVQRYKKTSSVWLLAVVMFGGAFISQLPHLKNPFSRESLGILAWAGMLVWFHYLQRRHFKKKYQEGLVTLDQLHHHYGSEIDAALKPRGFFARG